MTIKVQKSYSTHSVTCLLGHFLCNFIQSASGVCLPYNQSWSSTSLQLFLHITELLQSWGFLGEDKHVEEEYLFLLIDLLAKKKVAEELQYSYLLWSKYKIFHCVLNLGAMNVVMQKVGFAILECALICRHFFLFLYKQQIEDTNYPKCYNKKLDKVAENICKRLNTLPECSYLSPQIGSSLAGYEELKIMHELCIA